MSCKFVLKIDKVLASTLKQYVKEIQDFPKPGIVFRDISPLLRDHFPALIKELAELYTEEEWSKIEYLAGVEARGFAIASALAVYLGKGFIPIRKKGKLPLEVARVDYDLEYGQDALEMHYGGGHLMLVDDVLATGGTLEAAANLCKTTGHSIEGLLCIVDLAYLNNFSWEGEKVRSLLAYD